MVPKMDPKEGLITKRPVEGVLKSFRRRFCTIWAPLVDRYALRFWSSGQREEKMQKTLLPPGSLFFCACFRFFPALRLASFPHRFEALSGSMCEASFSWHFHLNLRPKTAPKRVEKASQVGDEAQERIWKRFWKRKSRP